MSAEDRAQDVELQDWERNNRPRAERKLFKPGDPGYGPAQCAECDDDMPAARRAYGFQVCTPCKELAERQKRMQAA